MPQRPSRTQQTLQSALSGNGPVAPEIDDELRQLLFRPTQGDYHPAYEDPPPPGVPPPSGFIANPPIVGGPEFVRIVNELLRLAPSAKQNLTGIRQGPTQGVFEELIDSGFPLNAFERTNLNGLFTHPGGGPRGDIAVNPDLEGSTLAGTVGHELAHAAGYPHGRTLNNIQGLAQMREDAQQLARRKGR